MGISIAICELEAPGASCREMKTDIVKVRVADPARYGDAAERDLLVPLERAKAAVPDWEAFLKRNRIPADADAVYMDKVKKDADREALSPLAESRLTGWVDMRRLSGPEREAALRESDDDDRVNAWDRTEFDEMNAICAACPLSWDKGRGCIGAFGPESSLLPGIAARRGCPVVASVPEGAESGRRYTPEEGAQLLKETEALKAALPEEGKLAVRRYSGPVERLEAVARISVEQGCGFYFFRGGRGAAPPPRLLRLMRAALLVS